MYKCLAQFRLKMSCAVTNQIWWENLWHMVFVDPGLTSAIGKFLKSHEGRFCAKRFADPAFLRGALKVGDTPMPFGEYLQKALEAAVEEYKRQGVDVTRTYPYDPEEEEP